MTSVGSAVVQLVNNIKRRNGEEVPQAFIIVSDFQENTNPFVREAAALLEPYDVPIICLRIDSTYDLDMGRLPHAFIDVSEFHPRLLMDVMERVVRLTSKTAVKDKQTTKVVKKRNIEAEEIGEVELPVRNPETLQTGYMRRILCKTE